MTNHDTKRTPWPADVDLVELRLRLPRPLLDAIDALVERIPYEDADRELATAIALAHGIMIAHRVADEMEAEKLALGSKTRGEA